jgi:hypothetical protein
VTRDHEQRETKGSIGHIRNVAIGCRGLVHIRPIRAGRRPRGISVNACEHAVAGELRSDRLGLYAIMLSDITFVLCGKTGYETCANSMICRNFHLSRPKEIGRDLRHLSLSIASYCGERRPDHKTRSNRPVTSSRNHQTTPQRLPTRGALPR